MLDEKEFLSEYGIRSVSKVHGSHPYSIGLGGKSFSISYQPAESQGTLFGGNSNWRGPIYGGTDIFQTDPYWSDHLLFNEYYTAIMAQAWVQATKQDGRDWSQS